ncbi:MAG: TRAP transporter substrate-binding protein [bacterium]
MKKGIVWLLVLIMALSVVGCSAPADSGSDNEGSDPAANFKPVTLRMAEQGPPTGVRAEVVQFFVDEVKTRTDGRVNIDVYWDSTLLEREEMIRGVMTGAADMGCTNVAYHPTELHTWGVFNTFLTGPLSLAEQQELKRRVVDEIPAFNSELDRWNQQWIFTFSYQPGMICSTTPIEKLEDIKGKQFRAPSRWQLAMLQAVGTIPVSLGWPEVYTALDRGTLDGTFTSVDSYERYSIDEVAPYYLWDESLWTPQPFIFTINKDVFNSLLEQDQEIIMQVAAEAEQKGIDLNDADVERGINSMIERSNAVIKKMSAEDLEYWESLPAVQELPDIWAEESEEKGIPGRDIVKRIREIRAEYMD